MKYFLSIEFENQGDLTNYKVGDPISFISMRRGLLKVGIIKSITMSENMPVNIPIAYLVDCNGKDFVAVSDYVFKNNSKVLNVKSRILELDEGFPLRT